MISVMSRNGAAVLLVVVILVAGVIALAGAVLGTTRSTSQSGPITSIPDPPGDGRSGVVFELRKSGGLRVLGFQLHPQKHFAEISVVVPSECVVVDEAGNDTLSAQGTCAELPVRGDLHGGGITPSGGTLALVEVEISKTCFKALKVGVSWPSAIEGCAQ